MTIRYTADIFCDSCGKWFPGSKVDSTKSMARATLKEAKHYGWSRDVKSNYLDVCPDCLKKQQRGDLPS